MSTNSLFIHQYLDLSMLLIALNVEQYRISGAYQDQQFQNLNNFIR